MENNNQSKQSTAQSDASKALAKNGSNGNGKAEVNKMKNDKATRRGGGSANGAGNRKAGGANANGSAGGKGGASASGGSASGGSSGGSAQKSQTQDQGGKYNLKKAYLNKFKFKLQKNSEEEAKAEAEANRCDPCNELKAGNGLDFGCIDWGKCAFIKPCCKKAPYPCGCFAYMCFGITFVGGLISTILLF